MSTRAPLALTLCLIAAGAADARPRPSPPASGAARWAAFERHEALAAATPFHGLAWRSIGPTVQGGRVVDVESIPGNPYGFYVAYATGGVWKTSNNGVGFEPLTDRLASIVIGDIAVDPNAPQRLWVGTGEPNSSRSSYGGLGVFRSDDGGATFTHVGLSQTDRIGRIVVDPRDGDRVCVAALGKLYSTGGERGVFCTRDAGATWRNTLPPASDWTGAIDLVLDPSNPDVLYAATWERSRTPWNLEEAGRGSGVHKSTDGGETWTRLAGGLPGNDKVGRIGLALSPSEPNVVYAAIDDWNALPAELVDYGDRPLNLKRLRGMSKEEFLRQDPDEIEGFIRDADLDNAIDAKTLVTQVQSGEYILADLVAKLEAKDTGFGSVDIWGQSVFRSDDGGRTWRRTHEGPLREIAYTFGYYFGQIRVAPDDADRIYLHGVPIVQSADGGRTWTTMQHPKVHVDYHAQWIDPSNPNRMIVGNDGGADITYDGGKTWLKLDAQPVGQFYTVMADMAEPYNVYGGLQDNGTMKGSSKTRWELGEDWSVVGGGDGMHVAVDTRDNETTYTGYQFGFYQRKDKDGTAEIRPREPLRDPTLRYNWNTPVLLSQHNQDIVYYGANRLYRSMDRGATWQAVSPELSTSKARGDVPYATITSVSESPSQFGLLWAGTDDGNLWVTRGGGDWQRVDARLPSDRWVSRVVASAHARDRAYVSLNGYRNDDTTAYVYATDDLGRSWRSIAAGLPAEAVNVVREDPVNADVLYVGTDRGVYVSLDRGRSWTALQNNLPKVPVHDLMVHPRERELIAATHGRSVWIVDVLPVQEHARVSDKVVHVHPIAPVQASREWRSSAPRWFDDTAYRPKIEIPFHAASAGTAELTVLDEHGSVVQRLSHEAKPGVNATQWGLEVDRELALAAERKAAEKAAKDAKPEGALARSRYAESVRLGHRLYALPGKYTVRISLGGASSQTPLEIKAPEDYKPRTKPKPKLRGRDDYATPQSVSRPLPVSKSKTKPL
ncbi:MAG TPA: hypothetical protein VFO79_03515 [Xanthomonadales bacterium]|nr:hypothetical protein [Xanthomonadales bacterium]